MTQSITSPMTSIERLEQTRRAIDAVEKRPHPTTRENRMMLATFLTGVVAMGTLAFSFCGILHAMTGPGGKPMPYFGIGPVKVYADVAFIPAVATLVCTYFAFEHLTAVKEQIESKPTVKDLAQAELAELAGIAKDLPKENYEAKNQDQATIVHAKFTSKADQLSNLGERSKTSYSEFFNQLRDIGPEEAFTPQKANALTKTFHDWQNTLVNIHRHKNGLPRV